MSVEDIEKAKETGELGNLDPMSDAPNSKDTDTVEPEVTEEAPSQESAPETPSETPASDEPTPESIAQRLEADDAQPESAEDDGKPTAETPVQFDPSMFTAEQLQALKRMLNATPDRPTSKKHGTVIQLRTLDGKILKDFGKVYNGYVNDPEEPTRKIATPKIKVWFFGSDEPVEMKYEDFMLLERQKFTVESTRQEVEEVEQGETISNETGQLVTMIATYVTRYFTITVDGKKVEIKDKVANA